RAAVQLAGHAGSPLRLTGFLAPEFVYCAPVPVLLRLRGFAAGPRGSIVRFMALGSTADAVLAPSTQLSAHIAQARHLRCIAEDLRRRIAETSMRTRILLRDSERIRRDLEGAGAPVSREQLLQRSPYARLLARLETMPVIEQAKGIIMAQ